jgi:predicted acylesterase/phospholipase RssA
LAEAYVAECGEKSLRLPEGSALLDEATTSHRRVMSELNRSGKYLEMRQRMKMAIHDLSVEQFRRPPADVSIESDAALYNALYAYTIDEMHSVLNVLRNKKIQPQKDEARAAKELQQLEHLAGECEVIGHLNRAESIHQDRCASSFFCLRVLDVLQA